MNKEIGQLKKVKRSANKVNKSINGLIPKGSQDKDNTESKSTPKENSDFITANISKAGTKRNNNNYLAYIELDNYACWVIADGIDDTNLGAVTSKEVVEKILGTFMQKPSFSKRYMKKLILEAHDHIKTLQERNKKSMDMKASVAIILSDYSSVIFGSVGDSRCLLIRDDLVEMKTKDDSVAHLLYEASEIQYSDIRFHNQRDKLTQYIGDYGSITPNITKITPLEDGDKLLLLTHGAWKNLSVSDIEIEGSKSEGVGNWLSQLIRIIVSDSDDNLHSYSLMGIFINERIYKKKSKKGSIIKFLIISFVVLFLLFLGYKAYSYKLNRVKVYDKIESLEDEANILIDQEKYKEAIDNLDIGKSSYNELQIDKENAKWYEKVLFSFDVLNETLDNRKKNLDNKVKDLEILLTVEDYEKKADNLYDDNIFKESITLYKEAENLLEGLRVINNENVINAKREIGEKIKEVGSVEIGYLSMMEGDEAFYQNNIDKAMINYGDAKVTFLKYNNFDLLVEVNSKISAITDEKESKMGIANDYERKALELKGSDISSAIAYYNLAQGIYLELGERQRAESVASSRSQLEALKNTLKTESDSHISTAKIYTSEGAFDKALLEIEEAESKGKRLKSEVILGEASEQNGDIYIGNKEFTKAVDSYKKAFKLSLNSGNKERKDLLSRKIDVATLLIEANNQEITGDRFYSNKEYEKALLKYATVDETYNKIIEPTLNFLIEKPRENFKKKLILTKNIVEAEKNVTLGDSNFFALDFKKASENYKAADILFKDILKKDPNYMSVLEVDSFNKKLVKVKELSDIQKVELSGDTLFDIKEYKKAKEKYEEVLERYNKEEVDDIFTIEIHDRVLKNAKEKKDKAWSKSNWIPFV